MSDLHKEIKFETEICDHLAANGWLYATNDAANYDRTRALFPSDVPAWVQETQPKAWETLQKKSRRTSGGCVIRTAARFHKPTRHVRCFAAWN